VAFRVLIAPRWSGTPDDDWYPWLEHSLLDGDADCEVVRVPLPDLDAPKINRCVDVFAAALAEGDRTRTICVGHSVSVQAWLRTLTRHPEPPIAGMVAVAGWWVVDEPWPSILPWIETPHDLATARRAVGHLHVLLGTDDPFTADQVGNANVWKERLGAEVTTVEGARHFNDATAPAVLTAVRSLMSVAIRH